MTELTIAVIVMSLFLITASLIAIILTSERSNRALGIISLLSSLIFIGSFGLTFKLIEELKIFYKTHAGIGAQASFLIIALLIAVITTISLLTKGGDKAIKTFSIANPIMMCAFASTIYLFLPNM